MNRRELVESFGAWAEAVEEARPADLVFGDAGRYSRSAVDTVLAEGFVEDWSVGDLPEGGTLLSIVGSSPEPVLLTSAALRPSSIVLAGSVAGQAYLEPVRRVLQVGRDGWSPQLRPNLLFDAEDPIDRLLARFRDALRDAPKPVVIDITGGRKTMAAVAFLLGLELAVTTVYVRGDYDPRVGAPKPGTERLVKMVDPRHAEVRHHRCQAKRHWKLAEFSRVCEELKTIEAIGLDQVGLSEALLSARSYRAWQDVDLEEEAYALVDRHTKAVQECWSGLAPGSERDRQFVSRPEHFFVVLADELRWLQVRPALPRRERFLRGFATGEAALGAALAAWLAAGSELELGAKATDDHEYAVEHGTVHGRMLACVLGSRRYAKKQLRLTDWETLDKTGPVAPWLSDDLRMLRNRCAHALGRPSEEQITHIIESATGLVRELAARIAQLVGRDVILASDRLDEPLPLAVPSYLA